MTTCTADGASASLVSAGDGERTRFFADAITVKHRGEALDVWQAVTLAGCEPPAHVHDHQDEWLQVLEGRVVATVGASRLEAGPGDLVFMPRGVPHAYAVQGEHAILHMVTSPGGFVEVLDELDRLFGGGGMPLVLAPGHLGTVEPVLARHGVRLVAPCAPR